MKFNFYGDSWCWFFNLGEMKSKHMKRYEKMISFYEGAIGTLNFPVSVFNVPAQSFKQTLQTVYDNYDHTETDCVHIIFVSNILRDNHQLKSYDTENYNRFMQGIEADIQRHFKILDRWAEKNSQRVLLIGGHTPILDSHIKDCNNLHVVLPDAKYFLDQSRFTENDYWLFFSDFDYKLLDLEKYDPKIIDFFHTNSINMDNYKKQPGAYFDSSDVAHPNIYGQRLILDEIFKYLEDKEWL